MGHLQSPGHQHHLSSCEEHCPEGMRNNDDSCSLNGKRNYSQLSTSSTMSKISSAELVYQRRRQRKSYAASTVHPSGSTRTSDGCQSAISSEVPPSFVAQEDVVSVSEDANAIDAVRSSTMGSVGFGTVANAPLNGCHTGVESGSEVALTAHVGRTLNTCSPNDNYSPSKSNLEHSLASSKVDRDDAGECSSSGGLTADKESEEISEREICISILQSRGLLDKAQTRQDGGSDENIGVSSNDYCSKSCKVCEHVESTSSMLLCDNCEDAFHPSCHRPRITILPIGKWLCSSCLKKKHKILNNNTTSNSDNDNEIDSESEDLGSLGFMFRDTEPYLSTVRISSDFQADVPAWCGPIDEASDLMGDPPLSVNSMEKTNATKPFKFSSIGNWIQCQEVLDGDDETICGKWRRAPLFEFQTDDWECFRCVLWDPAHADCAVPQEVDTEEVMRQLKYIDMLKPRLAAKRRALLSSRRNASHD